MRAVSFKPQSFSISYATPASCNGSFISGRYGQKTGALFLPLRGRTTVSPQMGQVARSYQLSPVPCCQSIILGRQSITGFASSIQSPFREQKLYPGYGMSKCKSFNYHCPSLLIHFMLCVCVDGANWEDQSLPFFPSVHS